MAQATEVVGARIGASCSDDIIEDLLGLGHVSAVVLMDRSAIHLVQWVLGKGRDSRKCGERETGQSGESELHKFIGP